MTILLRILSEDEPLLREVSAPVEEFDDKLRLLAKDMIETMDSRRGLGLAAVQVGVPIRLIIINEDRVPRVMVNPRILRTLNRMSVQLEGCLSVSPVRWKDISRPARCEIAYQDLSGTEIVAGFSNLAARAVLHEIDHLDGILITDKPNPKETTP